MRKEKKNKNFIKKPTYKGGAAAMRAFLKKNLKYPKEALKKKVEGTVVLKFSIGHQGRVMDAKVISGLGCGCDEEAIRLAKLLEFEVPKNRGVKVLFHKDLNIHFRLPKARPQAKSTTIQYSYTEKKKESPENDKDKPAQEGYSYTISI